MVTTGKKTSEMTPLSQIVTQVLKTCRRDSAHHLTEICRHWDEAVGDAISKNAQPAAMKEKILIVHVISSPWIQQLQYLKQDIIGRINQASEETILEDIKFKIGPID